MTASVGMLARVLCLAIVMVTITPTFYVYAVNSGTKWSSPEIASRTVAIKASCNKVRTSISNHTATLQQASERRIGMIDKVYGNLTTFANDNHLVIPETIRQTVLIAHDAASDAIQQLANNEDTLNCEDEDVVQTAAALKQHIQAVNDTMRDYRHAVSDMLAAVKAQALSGGLHD